MKIKVLFICIHNSARSQMAEAYLKQIGGEERFHVESAGFEQAPINQYAIKVMAEEGIDISQNTSDSVFDFFEEGKHFHYVVTVCEDGFAQKCPIFPGAVDLVKLFFDDPSSLNGTDEEKLVNTRIIRDQIKTEIKQFVQFLEDNDYELKKYSAIPKLIK